MTGDERGEVTSEKRQTRATGFRGTDATVQADIDEARVRQIEAEKKDQKKISTDLAGRTTSED